MGNEVEIFEHGILRLDGELLICPVTDKHKYCNMSCAQLAIKKMPSLNENRQIVYLSSYCKLYCCGAEYPLRESK